MTNHREQQQQQQRRRRAVVLEIWGRKLWISREAERVVIALMYIHGSAALWRGAARARPSCGRLGLILIPPRTRHHPQFRPYSIYARGLFKFDFSLFGRSCNPLLRGKCVLWIRQIILLVYILLYLRWKS